MKSDDNETIDILVKMQEELEEFLKRGPAVFVLWDFSLRMGFQVYANGERQYFRYPSVAPHPLCNDLRHVTDAEFRNFIKNIEALK